MAFFKPVDSLLREKDFFHARARYHADSARMSECHRLVCGALIDHAFNRLAVSNAKIDAVLHQYGASLPDSLRYRLLIARQINHGKRYEYRQAFQAMNEIIVDLSEGISGEELKDHKNTRTIWRSLQDQPKQQLIIEGATRMRITRDRAGLANLPVAAGRDSIDFVFDTGANFSTVTASTAKRFNMVMMDSVIDVLAITGAVVKSGIAVCPEFRLGNMIVRNAVFLVFADSALAVPQIQYQINGIIGFPVIEAMKEIQITRDGDFIVPQRPAEYAVRNMALDLLTPVIELNDERYTFDTGANKTILYQAYFNKHRQEIVSKYRGQEVNIGGAGGSIRRKTYQITFSPLIDHKAVSVDSVMVLEENVKEDADALFGNIGQDLIGKFEKMTINFASMYVRFE